MYLFLEVFSDEYNREIKLPKKSGEKNRDIYRTCDCISLKESIMQFIFGEIILIYNRSLIIR